MGERNQAMVVIAFMLALIVTGGAAVAFLITRSIRQSLEVVVGGSKPDQDSTDKVFVAEAVGAGDLSKEIVLSNPCYSTLTVCPRTSWAS